MYLHQEIESLKENFKHGSKQAASVSAKGIDWHVHHSLLVISGVCYLLMQSNSKDYQPKFNFLKQVIMATGVIPRGKARAPKEVVPPEMINPEATQKLFTKVEYQLKELESLNKNHFYTHHIFGDLNLKNSVKFLGIHTKHHLKIMRDILSVSKP